MNAKSYVNESTINLQNSPFAKPISAFSFKTIAYLNIVELALG